jgi:hypothetical protein
MPDKKPSLTVVQGRRVRSSFEIMDTPAREITYQHTVLCQTSLPYRDPGDDVREWEREQGAVSLRIEAGAVRDPKSKKFVKLGLPYGSRPRLIAAHLNAEALRRGSPQIEVESSLTGFVKRILDHRRSTPDGREIKRFKDQLSRLSAATISMAVDISDDTAFQVDTKIIDAFELWLETDERQRVLWPAKVELSPRYFETLTKHAVPLDERAVAALSNSPLALDVYAWLAQRLHRIDRGKPQRIAWKTVYDQFGQGYSRVRDFREAFLEVLDVVHTQYRAAKVEADSRGLELRNSPPPVLCRQSLIKP